MNIIACQPEFVNRESDKNKLIRLRCNASPDGVPVCEKQKTPSCVLGGVASERCIIMEKGGKNRDDTKSSKNSQQKGAQYNPMPFRDNKSRGLTVWPSPRLLYKKTRAPTPMLSCAHDRHKTVSVGTYHQIQVGY